MHVLVHVLGLKNCDFGVWSSWCSGKSPEKIDEHDGWQPQAVTGGPVGLAGFARNMLQYSQCCRVAVAQC